MNKMTIAFWFVLLSFQFTYSQLNTEINKSQKLAIVKSLFKSSKGITDRISFQKKLRPKYLKIIDSLGMKFPKDTLMLIEYYDILCSNCPSDFVHIVRNKMLISLKLEYEKRLDYKISEDNLTDLFEDRRGYRHEDIKELQKDIRKNKNWIENSKKYGTENCHDGGHTFYTVLYPDRKILSMYMRCWIDESYRKGLNP